jgi:23S rRNA (cytosine1962-C5)-methyltransferase
MLNFALFISQMQVVEIRKAKTGSIERKHPWIFSGAIESDTSKINEGDLVRVEMRGNFLAIGHFQPSTIAVRILSFDDEQVDAAFFEKRIRSFSFAKQY